MQTMPHDESQCNDRLSKAFNWRDHLKVHPAADLFPLLEPDELQALADDIKKNGLLTPIVLWREYGDDDTPVVLTDGRNRLDALASLGWLSLNPVRERGRGERAERYKLYVSNNPPFEFSDECALNPFGLLRDPTGFEISNDDPYALALSLNAHRRHLTGEQKRELIAKVLKAKPEQSNRAIAKQVKADDKTVASVRRDLESTAEIPQLDKTVGADGKTRKLPAKQKPAPVDGDPESSAQARKDHYAAAEAPDPQEEEDRKTCIALNQKVIEAETERDAFYRKAPPNSVAERFREHISAAYQILDSEDWLPPDVTSKELRVRSQMGSNLEWQVIEFEKMLGLFRWPLTTSEESRKLAAELKKRAEALGCTMKKQGRQYEMSGGFGTQLVTLDEVSEYLDKAEGKIAAQGTTACGMPIPGINNAKAVERYEKTTGTSVARPDNWTPREDHEPSP